MGGLLKKSPKSGSSSKACWYQSITWAVLTLSTAPGSMPSFSSHSRSKAMEV